MSILAVALAALMAMRAVPSTSAQSPTVVAETQLQSSTRASLSARLDSRHRYMLEVAGPDGIAVQIEYVATSGPLSCCPLALGHSRDTFVGTMPYTVELRNEFAVNMDTPFDWDCIVWLHVDERADVSVRIMDLGSPLVAQ